MQTTAKHKVMKYRVFTILSVLWELPQNCAGLLLFILTKARIRDKELINGRLFVNVTGFAVSLGHFIFWTENPRVTLNKKTTIKTHEFGHAIQSMIFGPLYLVIIGIPSVFRVFYGFLYFVKKQEKWKGYFDGYPEKWANMLGEKYYT